MTFRYGQDKFLPPDHLVDVPGAVALPQRHKADVQTPLGDLVLLAADAHLPGFHGDVRVLLVEGGVDGGEHIDPPAGGEPHGEGALFGGGDIADDAVGLMLDLQYFFCIFHVDLTGLGGVPVGAGAVKQGGSQLPFQAQQLLIQGGLGDVELLRRPGDIVLLRDFDDVFQLFQIHVPPP